MALHDIVTKGSTDRSVVVSIIDSALGTPETSVVYNTSGIDMWYRREGAAVTSITEATLASLTTAHTDGGFLHVGHGDYRLDLPDAAFATGAEYVDFGGSVTDMIVIGGRVKLIDVDLEDGVRAGLTALPNAVVAAAGGLIVSTAGTTDADDCLTATDFATSAQIGTAGAALTNLGGSGNNWNITTPPTATAIVDEWEAQSQADPTGFHVNMMEANSDTAMAANLANQYNGTGYTDDTAPSSRSQLDALTVTGAAVNVGCRASPNGFVMTTGTETTNNEDSTQSLDGTRHVLDEDGTTLDCYYKFDIGGDGLPTSVTFTGVFNGGNDDFGIYANAGTDASPVWQQIGTLEGTNNANNVTHTFTLFVGHVVSDVTGEVQIRVYSTALTGSSFDVDQVFVSKAVVNQSVGYANGAIWVDTTNGIAGTESYVNGTADNPVLTWANALTLSSQLGIKRFEVIAGSAITLTGNSDSYYFHGQAYTVALGGQSIDGAFFFGAIVSGTGTSTGTHPIFEDCPLQTLNLPPSIMRRCWWQGTITNNATGDWYINHCVSRVAGGGASVFDYGTAVGNTTVNLTLWSGNIQIEAMGDTGTDAARIEGFGEVIEGTCTGGTVQVSGMFTTSGITNITLDDNARIDVAQINTQVDTALTDIHLDHLLATDYDPASKPGTATALLNELVENDAGESRFTANALEQAPSGTGASAASIRAEMDTNSTQFAAIVADTNELQTDWADGGRLDTILDTAASGGSAPTAADIRAEIDTNSTQLSAIVADTNELQSDDVPGLIASLDAVVDTVKAETVLILADTNELQTDDVPGLIASLDAVVDTVKAETALIVADTNDLQTNQGNWTTLVGAATEAKQNIIDGIVDNLNLGIIYGAAATGTLSTTQASSDLTGYANDQLIGRVVTWTSGACEGESTDITDYVETNGVMTFTALTTAPGNGDTFKVT